MIQHSKLKIGLSPNLGDKHLMLLFQDNVMCATFNDTCGGDERDLGLLLQLLDRG